MTGLDTNNPIRNKDILVHETRIILSISSPRHKVNPNLHRMHLRLSRQPPQPLPIYIKRNAAKTPKHSKAHIQHNRFHKPILLNPGRDELTKPIPPQVLVDGDGNEYRPRCWFVAVDGVCADDCWQCGHLDSGGCVADYNNCLGLLVSWILGGCGNGLTRQSHLY